MKIISEQMVVNKISEQRVMKNIKFSCQLYKVSHSSVCVEAI